MRFRMPTAMRKTHTRALGFGPVWYQALRKRRSNRPLDFVRVRVWGSVIGPERVFACVRERTRVLWRCAVREISLQSSQGVVENHPEVE